MDIEMFLIGTFFGLGLLPLIMLLIIIFDNICDYFKRINEMLKDYELLKYGIPEEENKKK